jgi:protein-disulfide isomerase
LTLEGREKALFADLIAQLYAPCPAEAVSIRQCIEEKRPCAGCTPAALLLGEKLHEGASVEDARALYGIRFGNETKTVAVGDSPSRGPATAPVTIVEWFDFECPHCKRAMPILDQVLEQHAQSVRLVHKFYPLSHHAHAAAAARAAIAAQNQGKYWEMERAIFEHQDTLSDAELERCAKELKLDMKRFAADIAATRTQKIIDRDHEEAENAGLRGTPFILINGREFASPWFHLDGDLEAWVKLELELGAKR